MTKLTPASSFPLETAMNFNPLIMKENIEKSLAGFTDLNAEGKRNLEALSSTAAIAAKAVQTLGAETTTYYKSAFEAYVAQAKEMAGAQSFQAVVELQSAFAKSAMEAFSAHVASTSQLAFAAVNAAVRPLNERATAVAEQFTTAR
jgi:hypothetical protein